MKKNKLKSKFLEIAEFCDSVTADILHTFAPAFLILFLAHILSVIEINKFILVLILYFYAILTISFIVRLKKMVDKNLG